MESKPFILLILIILVSGSVTNIFGAVYHVDYGVVAYPVSCLVVIVACWMNAIIHKYKEGK